MRKLVVLVLTLLCLGLFAGAALAEEGGIVMPDTRLMSTKSIK